MAGAAKEMGEALIINPVHIEDFARALEEGLAMPKEEQMPAAPKSPYAVQKLTGEYYCQNFFTLFGLETVCLRYFNVYKLKSTKKIKRIS